MLAADGTSSTGELGYQTISVLPTELNQEGMNYVLVMTPQEGDDKQSVAQLVDLKVRESYSTLSNFSFSLEREFRHSRESTF